MLPLAERLRSARQFQQVFREGQSFGDGGTGLVVLHVLKTAQNRQCGFTVGKKVGNAVVRNLVKRRLRESYRSALPKLPTGYWVVVVARSKAATASQPELARALTTALTRAGLVEAPESTPQAAEP